MAVPDNHPLSLVSLSCHTASVGTTPIAARCVSPVRGKIVKVWSVIGAAIATADATITVAINGTTVTGAAMTITQSGSAAGDVDTAIPSALNDVNEGDAISFTPSGATGAAVPCQFHAIIRKND
jgi:hypothetical protein